MNKKYHPLFQKAARLGYFIGSVNLLVGLVFSVMPLPASAANPVGSEPLVPAPTPTMPPECTPPKDWDQTTRLLKSRQASKEWTFEVTEPEMDVTLVFFYYQDYDRYGCPYTETDCRNGECQTDEIGSGESPLGSFEVSDGILGPTHGKVRQSGRLLMGSYTASFWVTGEGSINIGMKVHRQSAPTDTPNPPPILTATPTATATFTQTATHKAITATATATEVGTTQPPPPSETPTPTADTTVLPPPGTPTPTPTTTAAPPDTLEPPRRPSGTPEPLALIPVTGVDRSGPGKAGSPYASLFLSLGISFLGLGLVAHGLGRQLDHHRQS